MARARVQVCHSHTLQDTDVTDKTIAVSHHDEYFNALGPTALYRGRSGLRLTFAA